MTGYAVLFQERMSIFRTGNIDSEVKILISKKKKRFFIPEPKSFTLVRKARSFDFSQALLQPGGLQGPQRTILHNSTGQEEDGYYFIAISFVILFD